MIRVNKIEGTTTTRSMKMMSENMTKKSMDENTNKKMIKQGS